MNKEELLTPCFIVDENEFSHNIKCFHNELSKQFEKHIIGYSFKTNSLPRLLYLAKENDCMAEVVSEDEYELAKKIGFSIDRIIYNGPIKMKKTFTEALANGAIVNIDSHRELEWVADAPKSDSMIVGLRVNFDLESKLPGQTSTGKHGGRFGFCYENGELKKAIEELQRQEVDISCLHMHVSNASKSVDVYRELAEMACHIIQEYKLDVRYIDFGGGYFGGGDNGEEYEKYIEVFAEVIKKHNINDVCVIVEPGASVVATSVSYRTAVIDVKDTTYGRFVYTDGSRLDIDPFLAKEKYVFDTKCMNTTNFSEQTVCGYTCMEKDRIMTLRDYTELSYGDVIEYKIVGSYTMCFNNLFINYLPNVYAYRDGKYVLIRERWGVDEFLRKNRWN